MTATLEHYPLEVMALPGENEVHVWHLPYDRQFGRQPLLEVLAGYLSLSPEQIRLVEGEHGRPALDPKLDSVLEFNWSHSGQHAVIALSRNLSIGVDIERLRPRPSAVALAERFFHRDEAALLRSTPEDQQGRVFLELWTAKEAVLKALGRGIAFGLHRVLIDNHNSKHLQLVYMENDDPAAWQLQPLKMPAGLIGAIAWRGSPATVRYWSLTTSLPQAGS